jgi:chromosomal replication initiator protein
MASLADRIGPQRFNMWFRNGTKLEIASEAVRLLVANAFIGNWVDTHFQADLAASVQQHIGRPLPVLVCVDPDLGGKLRQTQRDGQAESVNRAKEGRTRPRPQHRTTQLKHKLADFVVGECNRLAYSAASLLARDGQAAFNPLFIHGPCGVGKTHLLQGICNAIDAQQRDGKPLRWRYVTAEQFTNDFVSCLRAKKLDEFRARYRQLDLLAIDDVHFLANKKATQDEFLHTFNTLSAAGHQIVLASDAHPKLVGELNAQLVSRFVAGMVVKIDAPDPETRVEVLRRRAKQLGVKAGDDVLNYIAMHIRGSVRELEGALIKLSALAALEGKAVTLELATEALADHLARTDSAVTLGDIEAAVGAYFGITSADMHSSRRVKTVSTARMVAMYLARCHTRMSYPEIGRFMGKNHSSVILAVQRMEKLLAADGSLEWTSPMGDRSQPASQVVELIDAQLH